MSDDTKRWPRGRIIAELLSVASTVRLWRWQPPKWDEVPVVTQRLGEIIDEIEEHRKQIEQR